MKNSARELKAIMNNVSFRKVNLPEGENLTSYYIKHGRDGLQEILSNTEDVEGLEEVHPVSISNKVISVELEEKTEKSISQTEDVKDDFSDEINDHGEIVSENSTVENEEINSETDSGFTVIHESKLLLKLCDNNYFVLGGLSQDLSSMLVTLMVEEIATGRKERIKIDLYERESVRNFSLQLTELFHQEPEQIEADLIHLTDELEKYREQQLEKAISFNSKSNQRKIVGQLTIDTQRKCLEFLSQRNLLQRIDKLIEQSGVVGEENTRKLLFVIASTYKMNTPLHALVQGGSGSGKSHLINTIGKCFPQEDVMSMTRVTSKSFYHYNKEELVDKLMLIQDFDGLDEEAQYAFRELQSAGNIHSSTTYKDRNGNLVSAVKTVKSHFASLLATTKAEIYYDNMSRCVVIGVDESAEQTAKIINYQNRKIAGMVDEKEEREATVFIQNCMRLVKPLPVVNRFADKIFLPAEAKMLRRLNSHYQCFVKQITILHQYQRKRDEQGRLITEIEDLRIACDILFDAIMLKVDDLDSSLRQFFNRLKNYLKSKSNNDSPSDPNCQSGCEFVQREIRVGLNMSKSQCFRYMDELEKLEYVQRSGGYSNRGYKYKIVCWDDMDTVKNRIKKELQNQLSELQAEITTSGSLAMVHGGSKENGTPEPLKTKGKDSSGSEIQGKAV